MVDVGRLTAGIIRACGAAVLCIVVVGCSEPAQIAPFPGERWRDAAGDSVASDVIALYSSDCAAWPGAGFLDLGESFDDEEPTFRRYARDPDASLPTVELLAPYDGRSALSSTARFTGFETDRFMLFLGDDQDVYAYLVDGPRVEALPLVEPTLICP